ncbi:MAG: methyl-accepting chemotaxis protein, partial [Burkholderiaceae bacterium]|nr:methyl-accepting chemotaxis protein [Burkholderiaceae bacterium]
SSLQQTAASVEQLNGAVQQSAENARRADELAHGASRTAAEGGALFSEVVARMQEISAASRKMAEIINVIDGIAFQTEIKALIEDSVAKVSLGAQQVTAARQSIDAIVEQVRRVSELIGSIAAAAREQSSGIAQINAAVAQIDRGTQQNAALVEQSAAASQSLREQADRLTAAIAAFRARVQDAQQGIAVARMTEAVC